MPSVKIYKSHDCLEQFSLILDCHEAAKTIYRLFNLLREVFDLILDPCLKETHKACDNFSEFRLFVALEIVDACFHLVFDLLNLLLKHLKVFRFNQGFHDFDQFRVEDLSRHFLPKLVALEAIRVAHLQVLLENEVIH